MIRLASVIEQFEGDFLQQYADRLLPSQRKALAAMQVCRNRYSPLLQAHCEHCDSDQYFPHSCGNRHCPQRWVVDCQSVGSGQKALVYLGRYLYHGVIQEKDILSCRDGNVTFRYLDSNTGRYQNKTVAGADFLWRILQHVLPRGFRRARNYGFLHPNSKILIRLLTLVFRFKPAQFMQKQKPRPQLVCACCGNPMQIVKTRIDRFTHHVLNPVRRAGEHLTM